MFGASCKTVNTKENIRTNFYLQSKISGSFSDSLGNRSCVLCVHGVQHSSRSLRQSCCCAEASHRVWPGMFQVSCMEIRHCQKEGGNLQVWDCVLTLSLATEDTVHWFRWQWMVVQMGWWPDGKGGQGEQWQCYICAWVLVRGPQEEWQWTRHSTPHHFSTHEHPSYWSSIHPSILCLGSSPMVSAHHFAANHYRSVLRALSTG